MARIYNVALCRCSNQVNTGLEAGKKKAMGLPSEKAV